jgi:hypothetical protein
MSDYFNILYLFLFYYISFWFTLGHWLIRWICWRLLLHILNLSVLCQKLMLLPNDLYYLTTHYYFALRKARLEKLLNSQLRFVIEMISKEFVGLFNKPIVFLSIQIIAFLWYKLWYCLWILQHCMVYYWEKHWRQAFLNIFKRYLMWIFNLSKL